MPEGEGIRITGVRRADAYINHHSSYKRGKWAMLPVRTDKAIPKRLLFKVIEQLADIELQAPVNMYDVILKNTAGTGANIVATRNMKRTATTP